VRMDEAATFWHMSPILLRSTFPVVPGSTTVIARARKSRCISHSPTDSNAFKVCFENL
jgi:hypothetical protein